MVITMTTRFPLLAIILRWAARVGSGFLFVLWGAFFVEHLGWFDGLPEQSPPLQVWVAQGMHFVMLLGYLLALKWERLGSSLVVIGAGLFFLIIDANNGFSLFSISILPALLYLVSWLLIKPRPATP